MPLVVSASYCIAAFFIIMSFLPTPGRYLPKAEEDMKAESSHQPSDTSFEFEDAALEKSLLEDALKQPLAPLSGFTFHKMAFQKTYMDDELQVTRPRLLSRHSVVTSPLLRVRK